MKFKDRYVLIGILSANLVAFICMAVSILIMNMNNEYSGYVLSEFVLVPILMGMINAFHWRKNIVTVGDCFAYGFYNLAVVVTLSVFLLKEGAICLVIVSPLIYIFLMFGIYLGKMMLKSNHNKLNVSIFAALLSIFAVNLVSATPQTKVVTDKIIIQASPEQVWKYVVAFPKIEEEPSYWLFKVGLPNPVQSTAEGSFVGATRECIFSNGAVFEEVITELVPNEKLTFEITSQPDDPEIIGHLNILKGAFELQDNGDGTTTLIGSSWYDLQIKPSYYFDFWTRSIIKNVHLRVMDHIKELSEANI